MELSSQAQRFVLHFGEMGSRWGINRTVGQIYALLYIQGAPLNADQITEALSISRSNVSMGLKELQAWRLVTLNHIQGDRRDYFSTPEDTLEIAMILVEERRKRELDPTLTLLRDTLLVESENEVDEYAQKKMQEMHDLMEQVSDWSKHLRSLSPSHLRTLLKIGASIPSLIELKEKLSIVKGGKK